MFWSSMKPENQFYCTQCPIYQDSGQHFVSHLHWTLPMSLRLIMYMWKTNKNEIHTTLTQRTHCMRLPILKGLTSRSVCISACKK